MPERKLKDMIWLILILSIILLLITLILLTKLMIQLTYKHSDGFDRGCVTFRVWFGLIHISKDIHIKGPNRPARQAENKNDQSEKENTSGKYLSYIKRSQSMLTGEGKAVRILKNFLAKVQIKELNWHSLLGTGDAAHTAVLTGAAYGIKSTIIGVLTRYITCNKLPVYSVEPFYNGTVSNTDINCIIEFRIGNAILAGIMLMKEWSRSNLKNPLHKPKKANNPSI